MKWRNEQIFHLRQESELTRENQDSYFDTVVSGLFEHKQPDQILFSYLFKNICIGYGGLVHIDWINKNSEISILFQTSIKSPESHQYWKAYLSMLESVAFIQLKLHKIYSYAFDLRPEIYPILESNGFNKDAHLREHVKINNEYVDVIIHSKVNNE